MSVSVSVSEVVEMAVAAVNADERFASRGWRATAGGATTVRVVKDGFARVVATWIGGDVFLVANEYGVGSGRWVSEVVPIDEAAMCVAMTVDALAFE